MENEEITHQVFTDVPGAVVRIGRYGEASETEPALVPARVAEELRGGGFRIKRIPAPAPPTTEEKPKATAKGISKKEE